MGDAVRRAGVIPVPVRAAVAVAVPPATVSVALEAPTAVGAKVTATVHVLPGGSGEEQEDVAAKEEVDAPVMVKTTEPVVELPRLVTLKTAGEEVVRITTVPKSKPLGEIVNRGVLAGAPTPVKATVAMALPSVTVRVAVALPRAVGAKVTAAVQVSPGARGEAQPDVKAKEDAEAPARLRPSIPVVAVPLFLMLMFVAADVAPVTTDPKSRFSGETTI